MIKLTNINKFYLGEPLLKNVNWHMKPGEKIGLIGANGTGKTTQLRIICNFEEANSGEIYIKPNTSIGYLSQEPIVNPENTLNQELRSVFEDIINTEQKITLIQEEISRIEPGETLNQKLKELAELQEYFELKEGYAIQAKIGQVISGLGFLEKDRDKLIKTFSGGWQMRISIAKLLLESPDLLLLDEPTNHLDIKAIEWLENYLSGYKGGYIIVSHDRQFLDRTVERIMEMDGAEVNSFYGNYSFYLDQKEKLYEAQLSAYKLQQERIAKEKAFIERFRANAQRSSQAKSREKHLEKIEIIKMPAKARKVKFNFPVSIKSGEDVLKIKQLNKAYGDNIVFNNVNIEVQAKDKIALIGENGSGKTTLLRLIMDHDKAYSGKIKHGHLVKYMFFSQHEARGLQGPKTAYEELHDSAPAYTNEQVRTVLARFGLPGENVFKSLDDLSGGEKARIALSKMLMSGANLLLFDEPTNHLDIPAKEALEEALMSFEGTVIVISHDRKFIDNFANKIFYIENNDIKVCHGNYSYYKYIKEKEQKQNELIMLRQQQEKQVKEKYKPLKTVLDNKKLSPKAIEKLIIKLEKDIINTEDNIKTIEEKLANPEFYQKAPDEFVKESETLDAKKLELEQLNDEWCELIEMQEEHANN